MVPGHIHQVLRSAKRPHSTHASRGWALTSGCFEIRWFGLGWGWGLIFLGFLLLIFWKQIRWLDCFCKFSGFTSLGENYKKEWLVKKKKSACFLWGLQYSMIWLTLRMKHSLQPTARSALQELFAKKVELQRGYLPLQWCTGTTYLIFQKKTPATLWFAYSSLAPQYHSLAQNPPPSPSTDHQPKLRGVSSNPLVTTLQLGQTSTPALVQVVYCNNSMDLVDHNCKRPPEGCSLCKLVRVGVWIFWCVSGAGNRGLHTPILGCKFLGSEFFGVL